jgi:hypothetical protein
LVDDAMRWRPDRSSHRELALVRERWNNGSMARRQKSSAGTDEDAEPDPKPETKKDDQKLDEPKQAAAGERTEAETQPIAARPDRDLKELPAIEPPDPKAEPWPDATPPPMKPVEAPDVRASRTPTETMAMPPVVDVGKPPEMPSSSAPPPLALGAVEDPTHMPGPKDVPAGAPDDPAPPPGHVPPGDSRSLRRANEFALVYRVGTCVISRTGVVGTRGQWRVVEYPTSASASNSYAKECSRFVSEGFSDYRE